MASADPSALPKQRTFLGHPIGLYVLFLTEMWERFSYYGMRALLILYMVNYYKWSQERSSSVYKWYTSLVYLTPILGGFLADRYLGNKRAVIIGAVLMAVGQFLMTFEPYPAFYAALIFLILGNGFFKPNMSTQVGRLYPQNDARRDGAYTIFYMGINLGAFLSPLICGWLADNTRWGYHAGFAAAGIGMVLGLLVYLFGLPWVLELPPGGQPLPASPEDKGQRTEDKKPDTLSSGETGIQLPGGVTATPTNNPVQRGEDRGPLPPAAAPAGPLSEEVAERTPSAAPWLNRLAPALLLVLGALLAVAGPALAWAQQIAWDTAVGLEIAAGSAFLAAWIVSRIHMAMRDRVLAIFILGIFVVFFWGAFEQAGNTMNLWADQTTDRYLTRPAPPAPVPPSTAPPSAGWFAFLNPVPTAWFQSINALAIFLLAPLFAFLWIWLDRRGWNPSIPTKMAFGVVCVGLGFGLMIVSARQENRPTGTGLALGQLPPGIEDRGGHLAPKAEPGEKAEPPYLAGRVAFDPATHTLSLHGVLPANERDRMVRDSVPGYFKELVGLLEVITNQGLDGAAKRVEVKLAHPLTIHPADWFPGADVKYDAAAKTLSLNAALPLKAHLAQVPPGFDLSLAELKKNEVTYAAAAQTLTAHVKLAEKDAKALLVTAGQPDFRAAVYRLYTQSSAFRVSSWWLFWFYILCTVGELCLSPVGLSMVSKLAPAKFATMLMGLWLLTSFFGNFAAGAFGEIYDKMLPTEYFLTIMAGVLAAAVVLFVLVRKVVSLMHGVK